MTPFHLTPLSPPLPILSTSFLLTTGVPGCLRSPHPKCGIQRAQSGPASPWGVAWDTGQNAGRAQELLRLTAERASRWRVRAHATSGASFLHVYHARLRGCPSSLWARPSSLSLGLSPLCQGLQSSRAQSTAKPDAPSLVALWLGHGRPWSVMGWTSGGLDSAPIAFSQAPDEKKMKCSLSGQRVVRVGPPWPRQGSWTQRFPSTTRPHERMLLPTSYHGHSSVPVHPYS